MTTHDILAFAVASEAVRRIRNAEPPWDQFFSQDVFTTSSRAWPLPDFVIHDASNGLSLAAEFKPPSQSKREYLTGLGQAVAYTNHFKYSALIVPPLSDDGYAIAEHIRAVLSQTIAANLPIALLQYDPRTLSTQSAGFDLLRVPAYRTDEPTETSRIDNSFWAKWRDISPNEIGAFLEHLYDESRVRGRGTDGTVRDRAFERLWEDVQVGRLRHWGGGTRVITDTEANKIGWMKNYRNFIYHLGWMDNQGQLTEEGLDSLHIVHRYGAEARLFLDHLALALLLSGKHLVLINAINEFQIARFQESGPFPDERTWLEEVETYLEETGMLKRNPERHAAAIRGSARGFLKAEKTLWRNLELIVPNGARVYHPERGFIFDWSRITALLIRD
jgi:hypothetical protein